MATNPIFSYTKRDYESSRQEGLARIPILSSGQWTDLNATDPGIIILDYVHAIIDMVNYYQDHQALESFMTTAKERANIFRLAKQFSYNIRSAKGAICEVTFNSITTYDHVIKIPRYTKLSTEKDIEYFTMEDAYLPIGSSSIVITCEQGTIKEREYIGTGISIYSSIENAENQKIHLDSSNIDISSISITDNLGNLWSPVDYIVFTSEAEKVYQIDLNPDDSVSIKFGDGVRGVIPRNTDTLTVKYVITKAEEGKVGANTIVNLLDPIIDFDGTFIGFTVFNAQASTGGSSIQSSSSIRESAPGAIKAQNRAVTLSDFENLAKLVDGVADAKAYDINTLEGCLYHEVKVLIIPTESTGSTDTLKSRVYNFLYRRMIPPTNLQILTPSIIPINIEVSVKKIDNEIDSRLHYRIQQAVIAYFQENTGNIGGSFYPSDLSATISSIEGVRYVLSLTPTAPVQISELSVASLGEVTISIE